MTDYFEDSYIDLEYNEYFNELYEVEGVKKIRELSRQLRTFFNYQSEVTRYRFQSSTNVVENNLKTKYFNQKQKIEPLTNEFIILLKKLKASAHTIEEGIQSLFFGNDKTRIYQLSDITKKLLILIHYFSEEDIHNNPRFIKFITILAQNICMVKKCLNAQFSDFYEELRINYHDLEEELEFLLEGVQNMKVKKPIKQLEERLTS